MDDHAASGQVWRSEASEADRTPCCMVTESEWTWLGCVVVTLSLLAVFNLKYYRKVVSKPKNLHKVMRSIITNLWKVKLP